MIQLGNGSPATSSGIRVAQTTWMSAPAGPGVHRFATTAMPLPAAFRMPMVAHALAPSLPAPTALRRLTSHLSGRLVVANPVGAVRLGMPLADMTSRLVNGLLDRSLLSAANAAAGPTLLQPGASHGVVAPLGLEKQRAARSERLARELIDSAPGVRERLAGDRAGAFAVALALYEPEYASLRIETHGSEQKGNAPSTRIDATFRYRFGIIVRTTEKTPDWRELDDAVSAAPARVWHSEPWFTTRRLVPDAWIASHADPQSLAEWVRVTGRAGGRDAYWFPETWERFLESGVHVGHLTPMEVWQSRRSRRLSSRDAADAGESGASLFSIPPVEASAFSPDVERGVGVPPGYGLAECRATLEVAIVAV